MAVFTYQAVAHGAGAVQGTIAADSVRSARDQLRARGLLIESLTASSDRKIGYREPELIMPALPNEISDPDRASTSREG
jgi:type II secretory pathway component PulF